jgi:hypothetical protein
MILTRTGHTHGLRETWGTPTVLPYGQAADLLGRFEVRLVLLCLKAHHVGLMGSYCNVFRYTVHAEYRIASMRGNKLT